MRILLTLLCLLTVEALHSQAKLTFDSTIVNFGKIVQGTYLFENIWFTNTGNEPIIISRASTSDGGSYAEWPKEPIAAGQRGAIRFRYDTQRIGVFNRSISRRFFSFSMLVLKFDDDEEDFQDDDDGDDEDY
jgi:hypothetical protein